MPSTYTSRNRAEKQAPGENTNSWGALLNSGTIDMRDQALDGMVSFSLSGSKTLTSNNGSSDEARCRYVNITGGTGGTVTIPNVEKTYIARNGSSGAVTFTTGSGTTCAVTAGSLAIVVSEGGNVCRNVTKLLNAGDITAGTLAVANGGTGVTSSTGTGNVVLSANPTLTGTVAAAAANFSGAISANSVTTPDNGNGAIKVGCYNTGSYPWSIIDWSTIGGNLGLQIRPNGGAASFQTDSTNTSFATTTTASAANLFQSASAAAILRSTSSLRYKRDIEDIDPALARKLLDLRPVWYRSTSENDNPAWGFFGFIAEETHAIGLPQLVHYAYQEDQIEEVEVEPARLARPPKTDEETGEEIEPGEAERPAIIERRPKPGEEPRPDGFQYERGVVLHHVLIRELFERIARLEARVTALDGV